MAFNLRAEDLSFVDRAPIVIREVATLDASAERVWPALAEATVWTEWFPGMKEARFTSREPHGVGSTRVVQVATLKVNEEVLAFDENERFAFRVCDANLPMIAAMVEVVTLAPAGEGTLVTYQQAVELHWWAKPLTPVLRSQLRKSVQKGLVGLADWVSTPRP